MPTSSSAEPGLLGRNARVRPHWYALVFYYGVGITVTAKFVEDLLLGHHKIYSGEFFPWGRYVDWTKFLGPSAYWLFAGAEALLLCMYALRLRVSLVAASLALIVFLDNLGSFANHRLLMAVELLLVSLVPVPGWSSGRLLEKQRYWNLDLVRWQFSLVYLTTAIHKLNPQFLSGNTLYNLFFMLREQGMVRYSDTTFALLQDEGLCFALAALTLLTEGVLAIGLNFPRWVGRLLPAAVALHVGMASLMAYIWVFSLQMIAMLVVFLPDRTPDAPVRLIHDPRQRPPAFLALLVPGAVEVVRAPCAGWRLQMPDGEEKHGFDAWLVLLSLSPLSFALAETLRAVRALRRPHSS